jgi:hypothetical protein
MTGNLITKEGIILGGIGTAGSIGQDSNWGILLKGKSGTTADIALAASDDANVLKILHGGTAGQGVLINDKIVFHAGYDTNSATLTGSSNINDLSAYVKQLPINCSALNNLITEGLMYRKLRMALRIWDYQPPITTMYNTSGTLIPMVTGHR